MSSMEMKAEASLIFCEVTVRNRLQCCQLSPLPLQDIFFAPHRIRQLGLLCHYTLLEVGAGAWIEVVGPTEVQPICSCDVDLLQRVLLRNSLKTWKPTDIFDLLLVETASIPKKVSRPLQRIRLLVEFVSDAISLIAEVRFDLLFVLGRMPLDFGFFLALGGITNAFPELMQDLHGEHELIDFLFGFHGIVAVINTVDFKPFGAVDGNCVPAVG